MKRFLHYLVEGFLRISGSVTSLVIILIILFLFKEAFGLFNEPIVQKGYLLVVNKDNPISRLKPEQIKSIFDQDITNWNEVGDYNCTIHAVRFSALIKGVEAQDLEDNPNLVATRIDSVLTTKGTILYVPQKYLPADNSGKVLNEGTITPADF
ncbi:MAG: substrate-binding domain-containing protein, partial [Tannerellaceae bacterium]